MTSFFNLVKDILTFAKTSGTVTRDGEKNWPIAERRVPSNDTRNSSVTHDSSSLLVFKEANCKCFDLFLPQSRGSNV